MKLFKQLRIFLLHARHDQAAVHRLCHRLTRDGASVWLDVENRSWHDVRVYALRGSTGYRLGTVPALGSARFSVSIGVLGASHDMRLELDPIGSRERYVTDRIVVSPGQHVDFRIGVRLPLSSWFVS